MKPPQIIPCGEKHLEAIRAIFNEVIRHSTALYEYQPRTPDMMRLWFAAKQQGQYPVLGLEDEAGTLLGFAACGPFRHFPAYKYTVEHSVYVDARFRGRGVGRQLLLALIEAAQARDYHVMIGAIDAANHASIALHRRLGFTRCASIKQAGFKFGRWLDLEFHQLILPTPAQPKEE